MSNSRKKPQPSLRMTVAERAEQAAREAAAPAERRRKIAIWVGVAVGVLAVVGVATALLLSKGGDTKEAALNPTARSLGCTSCHSADGARSEGPTWKGLWGSQVTLADGTTVTADAAYIRRSVQDPSAQVTAGFSATMPTLDVTDAQLDELVRYIRSLGE